MLQAEHSAILLTFIKLAFVIKFFILSIFEWSFNTGCTVPMNDTTFELSVFWPSDTESLINELRFSEFVSLSFKTRLTLVTCFSDDVM